MNTESALLQLQEAQQTGKISPAAVENIKKWLTEERYQPYRAQLLEHIRDGRWQELDDVFWTVIPFGTGGRRGRMYPIGTNAINDQTIAESAQGVADYVKEQVKDGPLSCVIAYDTRHRSPEFARLCAEVMAAAGFKVYFLNGYRSTPELSFAVRYKKCSCGLMITASHNPPCDNAIKVYWSHGGQLLPPHDKAIIQRVMSVQEIKRVDFDKALSEGLIEYCEQEVDAAYVDAVARYAHDGPRDIKILYTPLHGTGTTAVCPVLEKVGFKDVVVYPPHAEPNGDFPNVPNNIANPENPAVFDAPIEYAKQIGADIVMATDPDCDRLGCAVPVSLENKDQWVILTGNQIGALLADYMLAKLKQSGKLSPQHYIVKTMVTTELVTQIAQSYGIQVVGDLLVGFKWIGGVVEERGADYFVLGAEESYGFLTGDYARDKDGACAAMLVAEVAAEAKQQGQTLAERLDELFVRYGCHQEAAFSVQLPGSAGMERMKRLMNQFRTNPPATLGGIKVTRIRDYLSNTTKPVIEVPDTVAGLPAGKPDETNAEPLTGPTGDVVFLELELDGNRVAVRPSGTEPKVKFYLFAFDKVADAKTLPEVKQTLRKRLAAIERDLRAVVDSVQ